jgi:two-component system, chemotaxis family, protein-glutamate methylesterase/glutaminase
VVGSSAGGLRAVSTLLSGIPADFAAAVVVAQHRSVASSDALARLLQASSPLPVREAEDKDPLTPGQVYLAPPDYHLLVDRNALSLSVTDRVQYSRPSIDVLFESAADSYGSHVVAVVLTGANADGAKGLARVHAAGGVTVVQDPETAESAAMPQAALATGAADKVLPLSEIATFLVHLCGRAQSGGTRW